MIESIVLWDVKLIGWEFKHQLDPKFYHPSYHQYLEKKPRVIQTHEKPQISVLKIFQNNRIVSSIF